MWFWWENNVHDLYDNIFNAVVAVKYYSESRREGRWDPGVQSIFQAVCL